MQIKNYIIGAIACLALVVGVVALGQKTTTYTNPSTGQTVKVGSVAGPEMPYDHITWGGVSTYQFAQTMTQNSSTTCNWQTPQATSTVSISARFSLASSSSALIEFGKSAGPQATTTLLGRSILGAGAQGTILSSSTPISLTSLIDDVFVVAPSTWLAVKLGGGALGSVPVGTCNFTAVTLP